MVTLRHAVRINGVTDLIMMKADVLDGFKEVKLCMNYTDEQGNSIEVLPYATEMEKFTPNYKSFPGWNDTSNVTESYQIPPNLCNYFQFIEKQFADDGVSLTTISLGPDRTQTVPTKVGFNI